MFGTLSPPMQRPELRIQSHLAPHRSLRYPSDSFDARVWILSGLSFAIGASIDLASQRSVFAAMNSIIALICFLPPVGLRIFRLSERGVLMTTFGLFWLAQFVYLFETGGIASPTFGGLTLFFLLLLTGVFARTPLKYLLCVGALHVLFWSLLSYIYHLEPPKSLSSGQATTENLLIFAAAVCAAHMIVQTTKRFADENERLKKRLTEAQNHLFHTERMAEIGKLVATTAHELAQPIQVIATASALMRKTSQESSKISEVQRLSERVSEATDRLQRVLGQLRNFSRKEPFVLRTFDLIDSVRSVQSLSQYDLRWNGVACQYDLSDNRLWTRGDSLRIEQVIFNLINNARDACCGVKNPLIRVTACNYEKWARISVWNNGHGIPTHLQAKMFEPYFTTKDPDKGTGLGLTICEQLIEQHGGRILFSSQDGDTCFIIDLPRASEAYDSTV